jgi:PAS domain S-box-containing protein
MISLLLSLLFLISRMNYLLFHMLAEMFSIAVAWAVFMLVWNTRNFIKNSGILFLGNSYFFVGLLDLIHTLAYKGMGVFPGIRDADPATQLWISARFMESLSLCCFPLLIRKRIRIVPLAGSGILVTAVILTAIFYFDIFPVCYRENSGLTFFKICSEYLIILILLTAFILIWKRQTDAEPYMQKFLAASVLSTMVSEIFFVIYTDVYDIYNVLGHFFKIISFYLIYQALIHAGLKHPYEVLFKNYRQKESDLLFSEKRWTAFSNYFPCPLTIFNAQGRYLFVNPAAAGLMGKNPDDIIGKTFAEAISPEIQSLFLQRVEKLADAENQYLLVEDSLQDNCGNLKIFETILFPVAGEDIHQPFYGGIATDITLRKQAETSLRQSEEKFRTIFEKSPLGIVLYNRKGEMTEINPACLKIFGVPDFKSVKDLHLPDIPNLPEEIRESICKGESVQWEVCFDFEKVKQQKRYPTSKSGKIYLEILVTCLGKNDPDDAPGHMVHIQDISEQKYAAVSLRNSEMQYRELFENAPMGIFHTSSSGHVLAVNPAMARIVGYKSPKETLKKMNDIGRQLYCDPARRCEFLAQLKEKGAVKDFEYQAFHADGRRIWLNMNAAVTETLPDGTFLIEGFCADITQKKQADLLLQLRLRLNEAAAVLSLKPLKQRALEELEKLSGSRLSFLHFVEKDQQHITLQTWSFSTLQSCAMEKSDNHYPIAESGIWTDCLRAGIPVVCNDYSRLGRKDRLPEGHPPLKRLLTIPMYQEKQAVAIFGLGNKSEDYTDQDIQFISQTANMVWEVIARKQAESEIHHLGTVISQIMEAVVIINSPGIIKYVNPAFERSTGYRSEEVKGRNVEEILEASTDPFFYMNLWENLKKGENWEGRIVSRKKDGTLLTGEVSIVPMQDESGSIRDYILVHRDISRDLRVEEQLRHAQKMEAIGALAGGIAHDFNNILFPIIGFAEMLQMDIPDDSLVQDSVQEILNAAMRARELVKQILSFSRQKTEEKGPVYLQVLLKDVLRLSRSLLPSNIEIIQNIDRNCPPVLAEPTQMYQVILNLVTNAFQAMEDIQGSGQLLITLRRTKENFSFARGNYTCLTVSDTGCGIDPSIRDRIFEPYFTSKKNGKGTGFGLSVVHGIVKTFGGEIQVENRAEGGTSFHICIPCFREKLPKTETGSLPKLPKGNEHILMVDDEAPILRVEKKRLEKLGYQVSVFDSPFSVLESVHQNPNQYDLVITDLTMPGMRGELLAEKIKALNPAIPVILCTGFSEKLDKKKMSASGIDRFLLKPIPLRKIAYMIRELLNSSN